MMYIAPGQSIEEGPRISHRLITASRDLLQGSRGRINAGRDAVLASHEHLHRTRNVLQRAVVLRTLRRRTPRSTSAWSDVHVGR